MSLQQVALDREWYDQEEGGAQIDETHNPFLGDENLFAKKEAEMQQKMKRRDGSNMTLAQSKRANELQKDMNAWEENRMLTSGVVRMREVGLLLGTTWFCEKLHALHAICGTLKADHGFCWPLQNLTIALYIAHSGVSLQQVMMLRCYTEQQP